MTSYIWRLLPDSFIRTEPIAWRELPDGRQESCLVAVIVDDLSEGAELQNADGVAMTQAEVDAFLEELP